MPSGRPDPSPRRVALIGAGLAAAPWLDALADLGCQVVTVATRDEARFARVAERFPDALQVWPPSAALASTPIDVCIDLSPATAHLDGVRRAAEAGVPLIIEKPLATSLADGLTAVEVAAGAGIPLAVCLQYRYQEGARALHDLVERGHLGPIRAATLEVPWWRDADYYAEPGRGTYRRDGGGVLLTQAVHALDLLGWYLGGPPDWVSAHLGHGAIHDIEVEDVAAAVMGYGGGSCAATVFATTGARSAEPVVLRLVGERATARLVGTTLEVHDGGQAPVPDAASADAVSARDPMAFPSRWHRAFLEDTLAAFDAGRPPPIGGPEAVVSLAVIDALERSSAAAARVRPAVTGHPPAAEDPAVDPRLVGVSATFTKTVSESDVYLFAGITGDLGPNHVDEEFMRTTRYGRRIAHGALLLGFASTATTEFLRRTGSAGVSYGYNRLRFTAPVFLGDTITVDYTCRAVDQQARRAFCDVVLRRQDGTTCMVAEHVLAFMAPQ